MVTAPLLALAALTPLAAAHFGLTHPSWRADTLSDAAPARYSQWTYPCAGVMSNDTGVNVTDWPLDGGSVVLDLHHDWTYLHVNLGLLIGDDPRATVTSFNMSLTGPTFWNVTGKGTLFIEKLALPAGFTPREGQRASIQVVTPGATGSALYNCADIRFTRNATTLSSSQYKTSDGISFYQVRSGPGGNSTTGSSSGSASSTATCPAAGATTTTSSTTSTTSRPAGAGASVGVNGVVLGSVIGMAGIFVYGLGW